MRRTKDSESISRMEDGSAEDNEALRRETESTSGGDVVSGEQYDVFLSFRGLDTRNGFTNCLYHNLRRAGIRVFLDSEELEDGEPISEVLNAVNESKIYIPIFSQDFASSPWCLREVVRMVERTLNSKGKKKIIPIFYDVVADDVKLRTDLYKKAIGKLKNMKKFRPDEVERWENALKTVGKIIGRELQGKRQGEQIELIVEKVCRMLNTRHMRVTENLVEDSAQVKAIMKLLDVSSGGVHYVGIHGVGGIGKTTLATVLFNKLSFHFEGCSFLADVRVHWQNPGGCLDLQKRLLSDFISSSIADQITNVGHGIKMIKDVLSARKVLIILDDLDQKDQLEQLAGKYNWFGLGSRIIFTTRNKDILMTQVELSSEEVLNLPKKILAYEVHRMEFDRALLLFSKHAFRRISPIEGYDLLAEKIVRRVDMLPLAIEVIGSSLYFMGLAAEKHFDKRELWEDTLKQLDEGPFEDVRDSLMISYKGLEEEQKEVFLDIACFFTNEDQTYPVFMWNDCNYHPHRAIAALLLRSLITIRGNKFRMHDQIRDLGRQIVLKEYPRKFNRVWTHDQAMELLERKERNEDVEALSLTSSGSGHNFDNKELAALPNLRFLEAKRSDFSGNFRDVLSKLRWLSWQTWQTHFRAKNFHFSRLVVLNLSDSNIKDNWGGWRQMKMNSLKVLNLTGCKRLTRTPDFSNFKSLEMLILARCVKLTTIDGSIGKLKLLRTFNINGCRVLQKLPAEFGSLQSLTEIIMPQNYKPFKLPDTFGNLQSLSSFILDEHLGISKLPDSIGRLVKLTRLSLCECVGIKRLPKSIGGMKMLAELDLSKSGLVELPDSIGSLKNLKVIRVSFTSIRKFPHTIGQIEMLEELHANKCWNLTDENLEEIGKLSNLRILDISYTGVTRFPTVLGSLSRLETLKMSSSDRIEVPDLPSSLTHLHMQAPHFPSIPNLSSLVNLDILRLSVLTGSMEGPDKASTNDSPELLPSSLSTLILRGINLLTPFSNLEKLTEMSIIGYSMPRFSVSPDLTHLRILKLRKCTKLTEIFDLSPLKKLWCLDLIGLESLVEIHGLLKLESLEHFRIAHCPNIGGLPDLSELPKLRHIEIEDCPDIREIVGVMGTESTKLYSHGSIVLERLLDDPGSTWLSHRIFKYDVFLSFRDGLSSIISLLLGKLFINKIVVYTDDERFTLGGGIDRERLVALDDSRIHIPLLSKTYASSRWCLHALACMVKSKKSKGTRILPILYDVEKDDVKLKSNLYRRALNDLRREYNDEVDEWEEALRYVGDIDGNNLNTNRHGEVLESVKDEVLRDLVSADGWRLQVADD